MKFFPALIALVCVMYVSPASLWSDNWPGFRGPNGQGISDETDLPTTWDTQRHVVWKQTIPGRGWSSPIVWADRVFVTTATDEGANCHVICLDLDSGQIVWDKVVFQQVPDRKEQKNSYATPTPVTNGQQVFAVFGDGSVVAVDFAGNVIWTNREVKHYSRHGLGASPILFNDLVIMAYDGSNRVAVPGDWPNNSE